MKKEDTITSILVVHAKGEDEYYGADAIAVYKVLENTSAAGVMVTPPIHLDDSNEDIIYNMNHIVSITARKGAF